MHSENKRSLRVALGRGAASLVLLLAACSQILGLEDGKNQGACSDNSQCASGFGCLLGVCRDGCAADEDCGPGSRCLKAIGTSACIPGDEACGEGCPEGTACVQEACRTECSSADDCAGGQDCQGELCVGSDPDHDDFTPVAGGGTGGMPSGTGGAPGSSGAGEGGAPDEVGGAGGMPGFGEPTLGEPCEVNAALACNGAAQKVRLLCDAGTWHSNGTCTSTQNCQQSSGLCEEIIEACDGQAEGHLFCAEGDELQACDVDSVASTLAEECTGKCVTLPNSAECAPSTCGDNKIQAPEECDDGNQVSTDDCTAACKDAKCGDGAPWAGQEECDDGNDTTTDACVACKTAICGDTYTRESTEECDDGNSVSTDACISCVSAKCGDGKIRAGVEECDDSNNVNTDACVACKTARCGDGAVRANVEQCDDGNTSTTDACVACTKATCGDGHVQASVEECDHPNTANNAACVTCHDVSCATQDITGAFWTTCTANPAALVPGGTISPGTYNMTRRWVTGGGCGAEGNKAIGRAVIVEADGNLFMRYQRWGAVDVSGAHTTHIGTLWLQPSAGNITTTEVCDGPLVGSSSNGTYEYSGSPAVLKLLVGGYQENWTLE